MKKIREISVFNSLIVQMERKKKNGDLLPTISGPKKSDLEMLCIHFDLQTGMNL